MKFLVHLETHQYADVEVEAPSLPDTREGLLLALEALDQSGGAEWRTEYGEHWIKPVEG